MIETAKHSDDTRMLLCIRGSLTFNRKLTFRLKLKYKILHKK